MKVVVVYKWARDPEDAAVRADGSVDWRGAKMTAGEDDPAVLEVGRSLASAADDVVVGLTLGDGDATWALARGVEQAVSVADATQAADEAVTASILAAAVARIGAVDVVVIGDAEAYPGVAPALAGVLGWPALLGVAGARVEGGRVVAERRSGGTDEWTSVAIPAVLGVAAAGAEKQQPGMKEVLMARKRPVTALSLADLGITPGAGPASRGTSAPEVGAARLFDGDPASAAAALVAALRADGVL